MQKIPDEILAEVILYLNVDNLLKLRRVSSLLKDLVDLSPQFALALVQRHFQKFRPEALLNFPTSLIEIVNTKTYTQFLHDRYHLNLEEEKEGEEFKLEESVLVLDIF